MSIRHDTDGSHIAEMTASRRAMVFLSVPWSGPERSARERFRSAADQLLAVHPGLCIEHFSLDEEAAWCQAWLTPLGIVGLGYGVARGAGSILWLECGRVVSAELGGTSLSEQDIIARSLTLWAKSGRAGSA